MKGDRMITEIARFASATMSPLLMPFYGVFIASWISPLCLEPIGVQMKLTLITLGVTCVTPIMFIAILQNLNIIKDKRLDDPKERTLPYGFALVCYLALAAYFAYIHQPMWMVMFAAGGALTLLVTLLVNRVWKISAHAAGVAGVTTMLYQIKAMNLEVIEPVWMVGILLFSIVCCGVVGSARIVLGKHSLGQVVAGYLNGVVCVSLLMRLFG